MKNKRETGSIFGWVRPSYFLVGCVLGCLLGLCILFLIPTDSEPQTVVKDSTELDIKVFEVIEVSYTTELTEATEPSEDSFSYYQIPQQYIDEGGYFPEDVQAYLWSQCKERDINYYVAVALIERESNYCWDASGDSGNSKGYMQIWETWHTDRMYAEGVEDLYDPYGNIRVGLNFLQELLAYTEDYHYVLMSYNMGESVCEEYYNSGIYSTEYSRDILQRAQEIEQELQG